MQEGRDNPGNILIGLFWGTLLSIPLWLSIFGWIKIFKNMIFQ